MRGGGQAAAALCSQYGSMMDWVGRGIDRNWICGITYHFAVTLCVFVAAGCTADTPPRPPASLPVTLTIGLPVQTGEDPLHGANQAAGLLSFEGLSYLARDGRPQPQLAERWAESNDGLTWTIYLRKNALFHDGSPVDAKAVKSSLERSMKSSDRAYRPGLSDITSIETPSSSQLLIRLGERSTFLMDDLNVAIVKDSHGNLAGTGPFVTTSASPTEIVMTAVPNYYRGKPMIDRIVWKAYPAVRTAWAAMMRDEIDFLYEVAADTFEFIDLEESVRVFPFLRNYVYAIALNTKRQPFDSREVRRALNHAVDRKTIIDLAFNGRGRSANGPGWPQHWAYDSTVPDYSYDPPRAIALLDAGKVRPLRPSTDNKQAPARFHFRCLVPRNFALWERMALIAQRDLAQIGVDMQLESVAFSTFNERLAKRDFDAVVMELVTGNSVSRPYFFWHSRGLLNAWGYSNARVDQALDGIRRAADDNMYREAFHSFQMESIEDPPAIFLALGEVSRAVSKRFHVVAQPGSDIIATIPEWRLSTDQEGTN